MNVKIQNAFLSGVINAIPSKSYAHRIAICNFFAGNNPDACCGGFTSNDITITENCLRGLLKKVNVIDCGESGSTLRFMLPLCAVLGGEYTFIGHGKLMQRPNAELFAVMREHGVEIKQDDCIKLKGKLTSGIYRIRGDISSQYVSGLLMALPTLDGDSEIVLTTPLVSAPYVEITLEVLDKFDIEIIKQENGFKIKGNQVYKGNGSPEGDWSNSAFFLCAGAINGNITVKGLNLSSKQGDKQIIDVLKLAGANVEISDCGITVKKSKLKAFTYDAEDCPDLVPITAVLGAYADGVSVIKNVSRLKIKESDRIESTLAMLKSFGIKGDCDGENFTVYGGKPICGCADTFNDHRLAMSSAILALGAQGVSEIIDAQSANKSYPTFFEDYNSLGGKANAI
ncbi:MAG: 3-phosphoshikimate 1-carboxyvinyltransferase [Clostridia bacterium]|nr:3-phosphoshikimate 1-carboxyvinyltransferase [Clostridia bacterium]